MDTSLFKVSKVCWIVASLYSEEAQVFTTIEEAADYLENIARVPDNEIDAALISMAAGGTCRAAFHDLSGKFIFSDTLRWGDLIGVA